MHLEAGERRALCGICPAGCRVIVTCDGQGRLAAVGARTRLHRLVVLFKPATTESKFPLMEESRRAILAGIPPE